MNPGILSYAICEPCRSARDVGAVAVAVRGWWQPIQGEALPNPATPAISRFELLVLGEDALQMHEDWWHRRQLCILIIQCVFAGLP